MRAKLSADIKLHHSVLLRTKEKVNIIITLGKKDGEALSAEERSQLEMGLDEYKKDRPKAVGDSVSLYFGRFNAYIVYEGLIWDIAKKDAPTQIKTRSDRFFGKDCSAKGIGRLILEPPRDPIHLTGEEKKAVLREVGGLISVATSSEVPQQSGTPAQDFATRLGVDRNAYDSDLRGPSR